MALQEFLELFEKRTAKSRAHWEEAKKYLPGGVAGSAAYLKPHPIYITEARGSKFTDIDGNEYLDLLLGGFPNILGHAPKVVKDAVKEQIEYGCNPIVSTKLQLELAKIIIKHMPHMEMVRFVNTGSEGNDSCFKIARAWTGKDKIAKFEGGYNGQHTDQIISGISGKLAGTADNPLPVADFAGVPKFIVDNTVVLPYNDIENTVAVIKRNANELAGVIVEPMAGFGIGEIPAQKEFLQALRQVTEENNILLIYDEIVTGFRIGGMGGAVKHYDVKPDLDVIGKPIGGGLPIGAYGGRRDIMETCVTPATGPSDPNAKYKVFQSGTFTGNPLVMAAGIAAMTELETKDYGYIDNLGQKIRDGLPQIAAKYGFEMQVTGMASMFHIHFSPTPIISQRTRDKEDKVKNYEFSMGMIVNGIWLPPNHPAAMCFAHTEKEVDYLLSTAESILKQMKS